MQRARKHQQLFLKIAVLAAAFVLGLLVYLLVRGTALTPAARAGLAAIKTGGNGFRLLGTGETIENYVRTEMKICYDKSGADKCYQSAADVFVAQFPFRQILTALENTESYPEVFARCHELTHYIGRAAYEADPNVGALYGQGSPVCHGGFYHGVIEAYFKDKHFSGTPSMSDTVLVHEIQTVCGSAHDYAVPRFYGECLHGIGHAMMFITDDDVPRSLKLCDALQTQSDRETCYGGVFMENSSSSTDTDHPSNYIKADDPMYPCDVLDAHYLKTCYEYQSSYFAEITKWHWPDTIAMCLKVPSAFQAGCFNIIGSNQVGYSQDLKVNYSTCDLVTEPALRKSCMQGVVSALGGRYVGDPSRMLAFCKLAAAGDKEGCYEAMGWIVSSWSDDQNAGNAICDTIPDEQYIGICKNPGQSAILIK